MTITTTQPERSPGGPPDPRRTAGDRQAPPRWWRRPWVGPLALVVAVFLAMDVPRYLTFDPAESKIPPNPQYPWHYPVLVVHILCGTVAIVTCCLQVWPALRQQYPKVHRVSGRLYVAAGVLPGGLAGLAVAYASPSGLSMQLSTATTSVLWMATAVAGLRMARQGRIADHRRWMVRSFALTLSIVVSRVLGVVYDHTILPPPVTQSVPELIAWGQERAGLASWPGWILPLLIAEWWLVERGAGARHRARQARRTAAAPKA
ncbi:DUF2306 domain-containing protein [Streptomyces sp. NPDC021562]|uniref:DUF2306 domain-containing protein n=1 Tax=Streptomyces sp. NPDC021562 TaxID=3155121 RepID=UPI0010D18E0B